MTPLISQLLSYGYGASQILTFVGSKFKNLTKGIQKAKTQGYDDDSILKFLSGKIPAKKKDVERQTTANDRYMSGIGFKSKEEKEETTNKFIRGAFDIGSTALGAYALYRSLPKVAGGIASAAKNLGQASNAKNPIAPPNKPSVTPSTPQNPIQPTSQIQQATQASVNPVTQQPLQAASNVSPAQKHRPSTIDEIKRLHEIYKKHKEQKPDSKFTFAQILKTNLGISDEDASRFAKIYEEKPKDILDRGLPESIENLKQKAEKNQTGPENINQAFAQMGKGITHNFYEGIFKSLQEGKDTFSGIKDPLIAKAKPFFDQGKIKSPEDLKLFVNNPEKFKSESNKVVEKIKKLAVFPDGQIGEIESIKNGIAKVNINGTIRNRKMDDLIEEPEDAVEAVQNLLKIPEADRSAVLAYTAYSPQSNKLYVTYHNGKTVEYDDFPEQDFEDISHGKHTPKTEGKNQFGIWTKEDEKSRGASLDRLLLKNPKYAKDKKNETWRYLNEGYDYWKGLRKKAKKKNKPDSGGASIH